MALVFQYGSNMSSLRLNSKERLVGDAKHFAIAKTVELFELAFMVLSKNNKCAATNILPCKGGRNIYGVVYEIPDFLLSRESAKKQNRKSLDCIEGEGTNYIRTTIQLMKADGTELTAITYVAKAPMTGLKTSRGYVQYILDGLKEHEIPNEYRQYVASRIIKNNPELQSFWAVTDNNIVTVLGSPHLN